MFLNNSEEATSHLAAIIESSEDAIVSKDLNGIIKSWNAGAENLFGYTAAEAVGQPVTIIIPSRLHNEEAYILARVRKGERTHHFETVRQNKSGKEINISLTISPIRDKSGTIIGASKIARDISEQKRLERELQAMNARKDEFLAILSHELRNPLAAIRGGLDLMHRSNYEVSLLQQSLGIIERQTDHITHIIEDLMDITLINQGKIKLRKEPISLQEVINRAVESCRELNDTKKHELTVALPDEPVLIIGDMTRIAQVVINLLTNAIKYTPARGLIRIQLKQSDTQAFISIQDNGIGLSSDQLHKAFEMFHRVEANSSFVDGLGVGLGIAKKLIEMHDGAIQLDESNTMPGCKFILTFPLAAPHLETNNIKSTFSENTTTPVSIVPKKRILIIDDNDDAAAVLQQILTLEGYDVRVASDGESGIRIAEDFRPAVCVCDIGLPRMSGYEVAEYFRDFLPNTAMIALSGWGHPTDIARSGEVGFQHHVVKSTDISEILELIKTA